MEVPRSVRIEVIGEELSVGEEGAEGWRPILQGNTEVGLLRQLDSGVWRLEIELPHWPGWKKHPVFAKRRTVAQAEAWAVHEIANILAMIEERQELDEAGG